MTIMHLLVGKAGDSNLTMFGTAHYYLSLNAKCGYFLWLLSR